MDFEKINLDNRIGPLNFKLNQRSKGNTKKNNFMNHKNKISEPELKTSNLLSSELKSLINNLDKNVRQQLLKILLQMKVPLNQETLEKAVAFLHRQINQTSESQIAENELKAFAFLAKNKLPITPQMITNLVMNISKEENLTELIKNNLANNQKLQKLIINLGSPSIKLAENLKKQPLAIKSVLNELNMQTQKTVDEEKIIRFLSGQQLINQQERPGELHRPLLALEIPLIFPENKEINPLYLQLWEEKKDHLANREDANFRISFMLEFPKLGLIMADVQMKGEELQAKFGSSKEKTLSLIANQQEKLTHSLKKLGFNLKVTNYFHLNNQKSEAQPTASFLSPILYNQEISESNLENKLHIDFRV